MPRRSLRSKKVRLETGWIERACRTKPEFQPSFHRAIALFRLGRCSSWLAAGIALPEDTDAPGEIKAGTETVEDIKTKAKSKNSRARRLSYVANADGVGPQVQPSSCLLV